MRRVDMRKIRDALRMKAQGLSSRQIASSISVGATTLREYFKRAKQAEISWPVDDSLSDAQLEQLLFPKAVRDPDQAILQPNWTEIHAELRKH